MESRLRNYVTAVNEEREALSLEPAPWGGVPLVPLTVMPLGSYEASTPPPPQTPPEEPPEGPEDEPTEVPADETEGKADESNRTALWEAFVARTVRQERPFIAELAACFGQLEKEVLANLASTMGKALVAYFEGWSARKVRAHLKRETRQIDAILFSVNATVPDFAPLFTKHVTSAVDEAGLAAVAEIGVGVWDLSDPGVIEWIKTQGLTKATIVLETTRDALRQTVAQGLEAGEGIRELAKRIRAVFNVASTSRAQAIARTEVNTAANYGRVQGYRQTGVVEGKEWITARDERVRVTHKAADKQTVGLHEDFQVGAGSGPAPGQIGLAEEDINCRCTLKAVLMGKAARAA
jgi:SPP1 gp7 family putative phage head morphogenesis protein